MITKTYKYEECILYPMCKKKEEEGLSNAQFRCYLNSKFYIQSSSFVYTWVWKLYFPHNNNFNNSSIGCESKCLFFLVAL